MAMRTNISKRQLVTFFVVLMSFASYAQKIKAVKKVDSNQYEVITLGAGCFWCVEAVFERLNGVQKVVSGYSGGKIPNPTYKEVCSGLTGHAEVVQVTYNPSEIEIETLLEVFFKTHNPTTPNRQGADVGTQYRSSIFFHTDEQKEVALKVISKLNAARIWPEPIVTEIVAFTKFFKAEDYHQDYFANNRTQPYCQAVINPKISKLEDVFKDLLKDKYRKVNR
jgi:peptide-methionine (S)-S-oxide reductase